MHTKEPKIDVSDLAPSKEQPVPDETVQPKSGISNAIREWTPTALMLSYFVFSISLYCVLNDAATKVFWFFYLSAATIVALTTTLEAYDGLTPLREARKATMKFDKSDTKFKTTDQDLPSLELLIDLNYDEFNGPRDFDFLKHVRSNLFYPSNKVRVNLLCREYSTAHALANTYDEHLEMAGVRICPIPTYACTSLASRTAYFVNSSQSPPDSMVAIFSAGQRPHPYGVRYAVEKLVQDSKIHIVQGRSVAVPQQQRSFFSAVASLEHDMVYALLRPGRSLTWGLTIANDTNTYWRLETLRAAANATASISHNGQDLGFTAASQGAKAIYDLQATAYEPCPRDFASYIHSRAEIARSMTTATLRYSGLAFRKTPASEEQASKWTLKTRVAVLYTLPTLQVVSHAIVQYLCMAIAMLITSPPASTLDFAYTIYFPLPISHWFMIGGVVCLTSTVFMVYKARSEFVPLWTAPIVLVLYPLFIAWRACVDIFAQFEVLVR